MSVVDLIIALIVVVSVIIGFRRGFIKTLVGFISLALAFVIAYTFSPPISEKLYDNYLEKKLSGALGFDLGAEEAGIETGTDTEIGRLLFLGGHYTYIAPIPASAIDVTKLKNIEGMISNLDPKVVAKLDAAEMQKLVNFLCSSACANKTISSCVSAYNKKYGTKIDVTPILKAAGVSGSTKIPAALSMLGMKIDVKKPILNVQKKNAEAAVAAAAAASKASSSKASAKASSSKSSPVPSSKSSSSSKNAASKSSKTSPAVSPAISSATTTAVTSPADFITDTVDGFTQDILAAAKQAARKIAVKIVGCLVFVVLFILVRFILMLFAKLLSGIIDKIPVVSGINKLLGGILGIAAGLIVSAVLVIGFVSVSPLITDDRYVQAVDHSLVCRTATDLIYGDRGNDAVTVGDSGQEETFNEDDFYFNEDDFDFSEDSIESGE